MFQKLYSRYSNLSKDLFSYSREASASMRNSKVHTSAIPRIDIPKLQDAAEKKKVVDRLNQIYSSAPVLPGLPTSPR